MANEEQLALLKAGVEGWNKWREQEPEKKIDLRETDLRGANFKEADPHAVNSPKNYHVIKPDMPPADLRGVNLSKANLSRTSSLSRIKI